jgi:hypothetical protein
MSGGLLGAMNVLLESGKVTFFRDLFSRNDDVLALR